MSYELKGFKQLIFVAASIVVAMATAGGLMVYYRLPNTQGDVKGAATQLTQEQRQQMFEACLSGQLTPEQYIQYKSGDTSVLSANGEKIGFCYGVLAR